MVKGCDVWYYISSFIWHGLSRIRDDVREQICWIPGEQSQVLFWTDNWLGYSIVEKAGIPNELRDQFQNKISIYRDGDNWLLDSNFADACPEITKDVINIRIPSGSRYIMVWAKHKLGQINSAAAYEYCRNEFPRVNWGSWIWAKFIPPTRSSFVWWLIWSKIPTWDTLEAYGINGPSRCVLCKVD